MWTFVKFCFALSLISYICESIFDFSPILFCVLCAIVGIMFVYAACVCEIPPSPPPKEDPPPPPVQKPTAFDMELFALRVANDSRARKLFPHVRSKFSSNKKNSAADNYSSPYAYGSSYDYDSHDDGDNDDNDFDFGSSSNSWSNNNSWNDYSDSGGDSDGNDSD